MKCLIGAFIHFAGGYDKHRSIGDPSGHMRAEQIALEHSRAETTPERQQAWREIAAEVRAEMERMKA